MADRSNESELIRLLYYSAFSKDFPRSEVAQDAEIADIIHVSARNNQARSITGLLLVHQHYFIQALEGPSQAVMASYQRIAADRRHKGATMMTVGKAVRSFSQWNMCARRLGDADDEILRTLDLKGCFQPQSVSPSKTLNLLKIIAATISVRRLGQESAIPDLRRQIQSA